MGAGVTSEFQLLERELEDRLPPNCEAAIHSLLSTGCGPVTHGDLDAETSAALFTGLSTGLPPLDDLLGGTGIVAGDVTELVGGPGSGKTQLVSFLVLHTLLGHLYTCSSSSSSSSSTTTTTSSPTLEDNDNASSSSSTTFFGNGGDSTTFSERVVVIDTGGSFSVERLVDFVRAFPSGQETSGKILLDALISRLSISKAHCLTEVLALLRSLLEASSEGDVAAPPTLVVIDSVADILAPIVGSGPKAHAHVESLGLLLHDLASANVAVVVTNRVSRGTGPALGRAWRFVPDVRLFLESVPPPSNNGPPPSDQPTQVTQVTLIHSPRAPSTTPQSSRVLFSITSSSITPITL